jgi:prephenate dehydrogenase
MQRIGQITVVGTGLLGTSLGLAAQVRGLAGRVVGLGRRQATLDAAEATGAFDTVTTDPAQALTAADVVVVAVPLAGFEAVLKQVAAHQAPAMTVTDVGSTKAGVLAQARRLLPHPERFVGAHPMAGSEQAGPEAAAAELFDGRPCVLTPAEDTAADALATVRNLWQSVGMRLIELDPDTHDQYAATISHVPHLAAGLLVALAHARGGWALASTGFRDTTRLAGGDPPLWRDILTTNKGHVREALQGFRDQLDTLIDLIDAGDDQALEDWLARQKQHRDAWQQKYQ